MRKRVGHAHCLKVNDIVVEKSPDGIHYLLVLISINLDEFFNPALNRFEEVSMPCIGIVRICFNVREYTLSSSSPSQSNRFLLHGKVNLTE
jgi:hypothetical protein